MANTIQVNTTTSGPQYINIPDDVTPGIVYDSSGNPYNGVEITEDGVSTHYITRYEAQSAKWVWPASHEAAYTLIAADPSHWGYPVLGLTAKAYYERDIRISYEPVLGGALSLDEPSLFNEILAYCPQVGSFEDLKALQDALGVAEKDAAAAAVTAEADCNTALTGPPCVPYTDAYGNTCTCYESETGSSQAECCAGLGLAASQQTMLAFYADNGLSVVKKHQYIYDTVGVPEKSKS